MTGKRNQHKLIAPYQPLPWQVAPWRDQGAVVLLTGSAGGGKSRLCGEKLNGFCLRYPGATVVALRKTRESMTNSTALFLERTVIGKSAHHYSSKHRFEYPNGSILAYGGMADEEQREQIRSIGQDGSVDIIWYEEATAFTEDDFNEGLARLRGRAAGWTQVLLSTNPGSPTHWIYKRLIQGGGAHVYYSGAADNRHNPASYLETLAGLTGVLGQRLREGKWVQAEGVVYEEWSEAAHLVDSFPIPLDWRRLRAIDFGYTNPFTCQWWAVDPDGRLYMYRELYGTQRLVEDWARDIVRLSAGEVIEATVADHDAEDRATLERHGVTTLPAAKEITPGLQAAAARLRQAGDGRPRLFLLRGALVQEDARLAEKKRPTCAMEEITAYCWPKGRDGQLVKEVPVKVDDHGMDAMRYLVMYIDSGISGRLGY